MFLCVFSVHECNLLEKIIIKKKKSSEIYYFRPEMFKIFMETKKWTIRNPGRIGKKAIQAVLHALSFVLDNSSETGCFPQQ